MLDFAKILTDGGLLAAVFATLVLVIAVRRPRTFLVEGEVPPDIMAAATPQSAEEQRVTKQLMAPLMFILMAGPLYSTYTFAQASGAGFVALFVHALLVMLIITTVDLVFIDWLILNTLTPQWSVFPGTAGLAGYKDYSFHAKVHLKLLPRQIGGAASIAALVLLLRLLL